MWCYRAKAKADEIVILHLKHLAVIVTSILLPPAYIENIGRYICIREAPALNRNVFDKPFLPIRVMVRGA